MNVLKFWRDRRGKKERRKRKSWLQITRGGTCSVVRSTSKFIRNRNSSTTFPRLSCEFLSEIVCSFPKLLFHDEVSLNFPFNLNLPFNLRILFFFLSFTFRFLPIFTPNKPYLPLIPNTVFIIFYSYLFIRLRLRHPEGKTSVTT